MPRRIRPTHTVDIERRVDDPADEDVDTNEWGEPVTASGGDRIDTVATDVPLALRDQSTEFVREESGERVTRPAQGTLVGVTDVQEGDTLVFPNASNREVRGVREVRDRRTTATASIAVELERVD